MKKYFISYGLIIIVCVVLLSLYLWSTYEYRFPFSNWLSGGSTIDTSSWKEFKNDTIKVSFRYPEIVSNTHNSLLDPKQKFEIFRFKTQGKEEELFILGVDFKDIKALEKDMLKGSGPNDPTKPRIIRRERISADGVEGTMLVAQHDREDGTLVGIGFSKYNRFYFMYYLGSKAAFARHENIIKAMVQSMKFLP